MTLRSFIDILLRPLVVLPVLIAVGGVALLRNHFDYRGAFRAEVAHGLNRAAPAKALVTEADLAPLPAPVQRYLRYVGVVGKPRVQNLHVAFRGQMRSSPTAPWMDIAVEQYSFFDQPTRLFLLDASRAGVPFRAFHAYVGSSATMRVQLASLFKIVDARGPEMNQSETVTMFNDMCLLAPATLIDPAIRWAGIDDQTVEASYSNAGNTIHATLSFALDGRLIGFVSHDRYQSVDGRSYRKFPWSTPVQNYRDFHGFKLGATGTATWQQPDGPLDYARFELADIQYNVTSALN